MQNGNLKKEAERHLSTVMGEDITVTPRGVHKGHEGVGREHDPHEDGEWVVVELEAVREQVWDPSSSWGVYRTNGPEAVHKVVERALHNLPLRCSAGEQEHAVRVLLPYADLERMYAETVAKVTAAAGEPEMEEDGVPYPNHAHEDLLAEELSNLERRLLAEGRVFVIRTELVPRATYVELEPIPVPEEPESDV